MAIVLITLLLIYHVIQGEKGLEKFKIIISESADTAEGKILLTAAFISTIILFSMILTGMLTIEEINKIEQKMIGIGDMVKVSLKRI